MLRTVLHTQELTTYARAWRRLQRAEMNAYYAALAAARSLYFYHADLTCQDYRNRYILADAAYTARAGQLARRRADFQRAERQLIALLSAALADQPRRPIPMKVSPSFENITIEPIVMWDNHDTCHYCHMSHMHADASHVMIATGRMSGRSHTFGLCPRHAAESVEYTIYATLADADSAALAAWNATAESVQE